MTLGRTRLHNKMITFPTIRDDDQLTYTWILNGMANNDASELHQFGTQLIGDAYFWDSALRFSAYTGNMFVTDAAGDEVVNEFDLLAQYEYEKNFDELEDVTGIEDEHTIWVGLAFNYNVMFNDYIGERRELVQVLHDYIP